ncbi:hypothetical protein NEMBOFW57_002892 [Staphylotrichum longicolle]|uniref:poly(ADP-ribose) glycohydrolase n=1 Tax=Staphylotrichum longicolle TaxID=669026 RepID=A0AAD4I260_9PEZI|nr:hypothetical protein NEMBOFW57_002892 [Staphylotrichum longicolle]
MQRKEVGAKDPSGHIPLWPLLHHLLLPPPNPQPGEQPVVTSWSALTALLDTIAVTVHGTAHPAGDYALLREAVASRFGTEARFLEAVWPRLAALALEMPALFPSGQVPILGRGGGYGGGGGCERVALSRRQAACLVVHQFLRTLAGPGWKDGEEAGAGVWGCLGGAAVVSANKYVGFGQSATQEEIHVGSSPEACPAVLLTPPLRDDQVLVVRGAQAMANITGQRRDIKVEGMPLPDGGQKAWQERTMLFMDALELDMAEEGDVLPDLLPRNMVFGDVAHFVVILA